MKQNSKHWLTEVGTREGNQVVYKRPYVPSHMTDIRQTFARVQKEMDEAWVEHLETLSFDANDVAFMEEQQYLKLNF